jgi:uncharacterized membrane protein
MNGFLFLSVIIIGAILADTRKRLSRLESLYYDRLLLMEREPVRPPVTRSALFPLDPAAQAEVFQEPEIATPMTEAEQPAVPMETVSQAEAIASEPEYPTIEHPEPGPSFSFEDLFGRKLPIWAGGITLIVAAVLLVKYSIDAGLLSPVVRIALGWLFGLGLIGGAEIARRKADLVDDDRVAQALAGAGVGSLYAATLAAANLYLLIGTGTAFAGLSLITAAAILLALRFGAPTAVLGLVGGLATPALVHSGEPNVPLLAGYLALVIGGLTLLSRRQRWFWLGVSALAGGAGWTAVLTVVGGLDQSSTLSLGVLVIVLGLAFPIAASSDRRGPRLQTIAAVIASLQLALLVASGGYAMLSWGLYGLLSIAFAWLTTRMPVLRATITVPLLTSLILAALWPAPTVGEFVAVIAGIVIIFGGTGLWRLWSADGTLIDAGQLILTVLGGFCVSYWQYQTLPVGEDTRFAVIALVFAVLPLAGAAMGWGTEGRREDQRFAMLIHAAAVLFAIAAVLGLADWTWPISGAVIAAAMLLTGEKATDQWVRAGALVLLGGAVFVLLVTGSWMEIERLGMTIAPDPSVHAVLRWLVVFVITGCFSWRFAESDIGKTLKGIAAMLAYGLMAQILSAEWLAIASALGVLIAIEASRRAVRLDLGVAPLVLGAIAGLWALEPLAQWFIAACLSLAGEPMLVSNLPSIRLVLEQLLIPAFIGMAALSRADDRLPLPINIIAMPLMAILVLIGIHPLYKQMFEITDMAAFVQFGFAERTLWELLLIGAGISMSRVAPQRVAGLACVGLGLAHNLYYSLVLHDPLWAEQAVGAFPLVNLLLPAFAIAFTGPSLIQRMEPALQSLLYMPTAILRMIVLLLFSFASLRQVFCGTILTGHDVGAVENILWSVLSIGLATGYLIWGISSGQRAWRIGSLLLMLAAVAKVFLLDASGLEGLLRITSFLALGFSLIGIGWLYSRYLKPDAA